MATPTITLHGIKFKRVFFAEFKRRGRVVKITYSYEAGLALADLYERVTRLIGLKKLKGGAIDALRATIKAFSLDHTKQATDTPPTTITLETLRTSAGIFRRVGICA